MDRQADNQPMRKPRRWLRQFVNSKQERGPGFFRRHRARVERARETNVTRHQMAGNQC